jgi:predicted RNase H-like HicB family nuclease
MTHELSRSEALAALPWTYDLSVDDGEWVVTIAELPDFFAAGSTPGEAAGNAHEALLSHLAGYLATGMPIPTPPLRTEFPVTSGDLELVACGDGVSA